MIRLLHNKPFRSDEVTYIYTYTYFSIYINIYIYILKNKTSTEISTLNLCLFTYETLYFWIHFYGSIFYFRNLKVNRLNHGCAKTRQCTSFHLRGLCYRVHFNLKWKPFTMNKHGYRTSRCPLYMIYISFFNKCK